MKNKLLSGVIQTETKPAAILGENEFTFRFMSDNVFDYKSLKQV